MAGGSLADDGWSLKLAALVEHGLFDHPACLQDHRPWDRDAESFGGFQVDDQVKFRGLLDWQFSRLCPFEDLDVISARWPPAQPELGCLLRDGGKPL